jgi:hypothetical protein
MASDPKDLEGVMQDAAFCTRGCVGAVFCSHHQAMYARVWDATHREPRPALAKPVKKIAVTQRPDDFHACFEDDTTKWECGRSAFEAIGKLVSHHAAEFGLQVVDPHACTDPLDLDQVVARLAAENAFGSTPSLVGAVMRHYQGKCNPKLVVDAIARLPGSR